MTSLPRLWPVLLVQAWLGLAGLTPPATAQSPVLQYSIPAPAVPVQTGAQLGYSVAVDGNYTVVGAPLDEYNYRDAGVVKVFDTNTGARLFVLVTTYVSSGEHLGSSVAISGTLVVVGAPDFDDGISSGEVDVFDLSSARPQFPVLTLSNPSIFPDNNGRFGSSVAISGRKIVVGASGSSFGGGKNIGAAFIYNLDSAQPSQPIYALRNPAFQTGDLFGASVGLSGTKAVVGAPNALSGGFSQAGCAYVYDFTSGPPVLTTLNNPNPKTLSVFGTAVAISGNRVVVGVPGDDTLGTDAGRACIYDLGSATPTVPIFKLNNPAPAASDGFGGAVSISGMRVVIGAGPDDFGATDAGSAYVYDLAGATPTVPTSNGPCRLYYGIKRQAGGRASPASAPPEPRPFPAGTPEAVPEAPHTIFLN